MMSERGRCCRYLPEPPARAGATAVPSLDAEAPVAIGGVSLSCVEPSTQAGSTAPLLLDVGATVRATRADTTGGLPVPLEVHWVRRPDARVRQRAVATGGEGRGRFCRRTGRGRRRWCGRGG